MSFKKMEITVVGVGDIVNFAAGATRINEIYMDDVQSMVVRVKSKLGETGRISRLNILDHGNPTGVRIGRDHITNDNFKEFEPVLSCLSPYFAEDGFAHLQHCEIGQNSSLLIKFAKCFGVPIYAGTGAHNPVYRFNFGEYVKCLPVDLCVLNVERP